MSEIDVSNTITFKSPNQKMHEIIPNLFLGSMFASQDRTLLDLHNISYILQVAAECSPKFPSNFVYKIIPANDYEEYQIDKHFEVAILVYE